MSEKQEHTPGHCTGSTRKYRALIECIPRIGREKEQLAKLFRRIPIIRNNARNAVKLFEIKFVRLFEIFTNTGHSDLPRQNDEEV